MPRDEQMAGHRVLFLEQTDSTNAQARRMVAAGVLAAGDVVVAERQSAGRGRRGRSWITVPGRWIWRRAFSPKPCRASSRGFAAATSEARETTIRTMGVTARFFR